MQASELSQHSRHAHRGITLALASLFIQFFLFSVASAQEKKVPVSSPGDTPATAGPLAQGLSPKLDKRDLAKAMKLVADWQLSRLPAEAQVDWTWAALYTGFMAVPSNVAGDKYKDAMMQVAEQLQWKPGPRIVHADDQAVGQMYLDQYTIHKDPKMLDSMRAREGFLVCEMTNHSNRPAFVYVQLNCGGFYGGTGLIGLMIRLFSAFFRVSHLTMGH